MVTGVDIYIIITEAVCLEGFVYFAAYFMHMCAMCVLTMYMLYDIYTMYFTILKLKY